MANLKLLVPGTSGTKLLLNGQDIGWPLELMAQGWSTGQSTMSLLFDKLGIGRTPQQIVQLMSMEFADAVSWAPTKTTLVPGGDVQPGPVLQVAYNQFMPEFDTFPYDWRSDIRHSAELLLAKLQGQTGPWKILAHSQGCLVVIAAAQRYAEEHDGDTQAFSRLVSHAALVAPPLFGTITAADAILNGENLTANFKTEFQQVVRTWPAIHQMLPAWAGSVRIRTGQAPSQPAPFTLQDSQAWAGSNVSDDMLRRARVTASQYLSDPFTMMNGVKWRVFLSSAWPTLNTALIDNGIMTLNAGSEPGDTLVPQHVTVALAGANALAGFHTFGNPGQKDTMVHFMLVDDPTVATDIKSLFQQ